MASGIYAIQQISTGKLYIGSAANIKQRWARHRTALRGNKHHNVLLQRAWTKHGEEDFRFRILDYVDVEDLLVAEQQWFETANPFFNIDPVAGSRIGSTNLRERTKSLLCGKGLHTFTPENTRIGTRGERICRQCRYEYRKAWRANLKALNPVAPRPLKTHCKRGHELSGDNVKIYNGVQRDCQICVEIRYLAQPRTRRNKKKPNWTEEQLEEIRNAPWPDISDNALAKKYGGNHQTISKIRLGKSHPKR